MAIRISRVLSLSKIVANLFKKPHLASYVSRRYLQEFPELKLDNSLPKDYVLILPEPLNEHANSNEILRLPKIGEPETDFSKLNTESIFKGLSQTICSYENFIADVNNELSSSNKPICEFFKDIERHLYPMDTAFSILMVLSYLDSKNYNHPEIYDLQVRYFSSLEKRFGGNFKESIQNYASRNDVTVSGIDKRMVQIYLLENPLKATSRPLDEATFNEYKLLLRKDTSQFQINLAGANQLFSHTVDDPDILTVVSPEFDDCQELHHKERTPLKITNATYQKFMQVCPDRFVRHNLWQTRKKRCSPKALPKYNNTNIITNIRILRRKIADLSGYRTHVDFKLEKAMAQSKQQILDNLKLLNANNLLNLRDSLQELNDYAADNSFEDSSQLGIQEYDVDYWTHKYMHEILIGKSEADLKVYFPLHVVLKGLQAYFKNYLSVELILKSNQNDRLWAEDVQILEVSRKNQPLGTIIFDPYQRAAKKLLEPFHGRLRGRSHDFECLPMRLVSTSYKLDPITRQALLSVTDIVDLFYCYGTVLQRLLYNYDYYELNTFGGFEIDANNLLPNLCVAHLLTDHRILQSCSDRGKSKSIDAELASRILKAATYFKSFRTWQELYLAHLDLEAHSILSDTKSLIQEIYPIYSPFSRDPDDFDYCAMASIFVGPNDGTQYAQLWSKQLANFCLSKTELQNGSDGMASIEVDKIRDFNDRLLDSLFAPDNFDTSKKLLSLVGRDFEPSKSSLGVL